MAVLIPKQAPLEQVSTGIRRFTEQDGVGAWEIYDYAGVARALKDARFSARRAGRWVNSAVANGVSDAAEYAQRRRQLAPLKRLFLRSMLFRDGEAQRQARRLLAHYFHPSRLQQHELWMQRLAAELWHSALVPIKGGELAEIECIETIARPFPALFIAHLLGLPGSQWTEFADLAARVTAFIAEPAADYVLAQQAQEALLCLLERMQHSSATAHKESVLGQLRLHYTLDSHPSLDLLAQLMTSLLAAYDTSRGLLGNGLSALAKHPDQWALLLARPESLPLALRELLRFDAPVRYTGRRLLTDVQWGEHTLRRGEWVRLRLDLANYDSAVYSRPQRLNLYRREAPHLAFGTGPHVCLGAALSYMQAQAVLGVLLEQQKRLSFHRETFLYGEQATYSHRATLYLGISSSLEEGATC